jgi:hypothetical protein
MTSPESEGNLRAELRLVGDAAEFVIATEHPIYQNRIVHMGWLPAGKNLFVRRVAAVADIDRIFDNFARHLEEMVLQSARLRPVPWQDALEEFLIRVDRSNLNWWLYGSGALAVRGIDVDPGDLDFVVDDAQGRSQALAGRRDGSERYRRSRWALSTASSRRRCALGGSV